MSEPQTSVCPKCGAAKLYAEMPSGVSVPVGYECGTSVGRAGDPYAPTHKCRIRELESTVARLMEENAVLKELDIRYCEMNVKLTEENAAFAAENAALKARIAESE